MRDVRTVMVGAGVVALVAGACLFIPPAKTAESAAPNPSALAPAPTTFVELRKIESPQDGWTGTKEQAAKLFHAERDRLGDAFAVEVLRYLKSDRDRPYWVAAFLTDPAYLDGRPADPALALLVLENGICLCQADAYGREQIHRMTTLSVAAAVVSAKLELTELASAHKSRALAGRRNRRFPAPMPELSPEDQAVFDAIEVVRPTRGGGGTGSGEPPKDTGGL